MGQALRLPENGGKVDVGAPQSGRRGNLGRRDGPRENSADHRFSGRPAEERNVQHLSDRVPCDSDVPLGQGVQEVGPRVQSLRAARQRL